MLNDFGQRSLTTLVVLIHQKLPHNSWPRATWNYAPEGWLTVVRHSTDGTLLPSFPLMDCKMAQLVLILVVPQARTPMVRYRKCAFAVSAYTPGISYLIMGSAT